MDDERLNLLRYRDDHYDAAGRSTSKFSSMKGWVCNVFKDFRNFINKGSIIELAIGIVIGEAFASVVNSFVVDVFSPILGLITSSKLSEAFLVLRKGPHFPYNTREEAQSDGAVTWNYGNFIQLLLNFLCIAVCLFMVMKMSQSVRRKRISSNNTKECPKCFSEIDGRATKCAHCSTDLISSLQL